MNTEISPLEEKLCDFIDFNPAEQRVESDLRIEAIVANDLPIDYFRVRKTLVDILINHVRSDAPRLVLIYNIAITKFNLLAPQCPIDHFKSKKLQLLMKEGFHPIVSSYPNDAIAEHVPCTREYIEAFGRPFGCYHWAEKYFPKICLFENYGGKVILINPLNRQKRYEPQIAVSDQTFACVCHAGLMRSQTVRLILKLMQQKLGYHWGNENLMPAHGVQGGYDPLEEPRSSVTDDSLCLAEFCRAFDMPRPKRFGIDKAPEKFIEEYYRHKSDMNKIFITFMDVGFTIVERLLKANPETNLRGITVVIIPDGDQISNCFIEGKFFKLFSQLVTEEQKKPAHERLKLSNLSAEDRREVFNTVTGLREPNDQFQHKLAHFFSEVNLEFSDWDGQFKSIMIAEAYRAYFWRWAGLFVPVKPAP